MTYIDIDLFRSYMAVSRGTDTSDDALLTLALQAAENAINDATDRDFTVATGTPVARPFTAISGDLLFVDDFVSLTSVSDLGGTVSASDYLPVPVRRGHAYNAIRRRTCWPVTNWPDITVTADWGWTAIPPGIKNACLILAKDVASNQQVSFGIAAFTEYAGVRAKENPQVAMLLAPYDLRIPFV